MVIGDRLGMDTGLIAKPQGQFADPPVLFMPTVEATEKTYDQRVPGR